MDVGSAWANYVKRLGKLDTEATKKVGEYIGSIPGFSFTNPEDMNKLVAYAYGISAQYGEGAAALACEMYDAIGIASGQILPPAEPADIPDMDEVAKAVRGTAKTENPDNVSRSIGRLVKRTGADTTLKNAIRDGAEFAWIPNGDSCAFCITLASRGWQTASAKALKNGHAEHIHSNCDCTYGVRFNGKPTYKNYDPDKYLEQYEAAEGGNSKDKINSIRRIKYQENKDRINAQKRVAYAERKIIEAIQEIKSQDVTGEYLKMATPRVGNFNEQLGFKDTNGEKKNAKWIYDTFGGDITLLAEDHPEGKPNPDYLWRSKYWDLKSLETHKPNTVDKRIRHGVSQIQEMPGGLILDFSESPFSFAEALLKTDEFAQKRAKSNMDVIVKKDELFRVIRVSK